MSDNVAIIDKYNSGIDYSKYFDFEFELFHLLSKNIKKPLVKDITLNTIDDTKDDYFNSDFFDFVILIGADPCKKVGKITSVIKYQGYLVDNKYIPLTNPNMLLFKPEGKVAFNIALGNIHEYINGTIQNNNNLNLQLINNEEEAKIYLTNVLDQVNKGQITKIGLDTETSALYSRDGYILGICMATSDTKGSYISTDIMDDYIVELYQQIFNKVKVVFHNAKFDLHFLTYHFNFKFKNYDDTMLLHYCLDERTGTHDLKTLAIKYTDLGDYDKELEEYKRNYCKTNKMKLEAFTYDLFPFDIIGPYAATDPIATLILYNKFYNKVIKSPKLSKVYTDLLLKGTKFLLEIEDNGVPFSREELLKAQNKLNDIIFKKERKLYDFKEIVEFELLHNKIFNVNSPAHLRELFFEILKLSGPGKLTDTGAMSTDAEVLEYLSKLHDLPNLILSIKKAKKIKATYVDKILINLDRDGRLRTGFNLHTTTSGRLSSSGKLNMQQLPRDDKTVKKCIKARDGWKIISQDR